MTFGSLMGSLLFFGHIDYLEGGQLRPIVSQLPKFGCILMKLDELNVNDGGLAEQLDGKIIEI